MQRCVPVCSLANEDACTNRPVWLTWKAKATSKKLTPWQKLEQRRAESFQPPGNVALLTRLSRSKNPVNLDRPKAIESPNPRCRIKGRSIYLGETGHRQPPLLKTTVRSFTGSTLEGDRIAQLAARLPGTSPHDARPALHNGLRIRPHPAASIHVSGTRLRRSLMRTHRPACGARVT